MSNSTALLPFSPADVVSAVISLPVPALAALAVFIGIPVAAIILNVAWQLVR